MKKSNVQIGLIAAVLLLLANSAMAFPTMLADFNPTVPDGGSTALLLIAGAGGLALLRRFAHRKS